MMMILLLDLSIMKKDFKFFKDCVRSIERDRVQSIYTHTIRCASISSIPPFAAYYTLYTHPP